ncbi:pentraxin-related protein PTX3-like [Eucyclogobius newberryi]|uniref:pentraxin-related protein PTX3-like n=1 Tax=Eucyclogobius newberryi TaxID=166745 RepID=UPI003B5C1BB2
MFVLVWSVLWSLGCFATSLNEVEYDANCAENYNNEISLDQQDDAPSPGRCRDDAPRWDKLFTALEDSHMRQNMLLSSAEQNCAGGAAGAVKMLWDRLTKGGCHLCAANMERICKSQAEHLDSTVRREFSESMNRHADAERSLNWTLQRVLHQSKETNERLKRLEDNSKTSPRPTVSSGGLKEQDVANRWSDKGSIGETLVTIATELRRIQVQLDGLIEEARIKDKGDT